MNEFKISMHKIPLKTEPNTATMNTLETSIAEHIEPINEQNIKTFVELVGSKGCTFCPSTFKDGIKSRENFEQLQLLPLCFDSLNNKEISFIKVKARADQYNLPILFAYDIYSSQYSSRKKFSVVFLNHIPFYKLEEAKAMQKALLTMFPEADMRYSDPTNLYKGGNALLYFDDTIPTLNAEWLFMNMSLYLKNQYGATNYKRKLTEFCKKTDIALNTRNLPDITITEEPSEIIIDNKNNKNSPNCTIKYNYGENLLNTNYHINFNSNNTSNSQSILSSNKNHSALHRSYRSDMLKNISSTCRLYQEFESGTRKLHMYELMGLATNMNHIESGAIKFKTILSSIPSYSKEVQYKNWDFYLYWIKDKTPRSCISFCPYHISCSHGQNILSTSKPKYHQIERIANQDNNFVSLDEAWKNFNENFQIAVASDKMIWHIIKSQTALGKTESVLRFLKDTQLNVLIVVPTNKLKREICKRARKIGIDIIASPSLHELSDDIPKSIWCEIQALYDEGKSPMPCLEKAIAENDPNCSKLFRQYKQALSDFHNTTGHAITTHRRLTKMDISKYDLVIVDEDIIYSTIIPNRDTVSISNLKKLKKKLATSDPLATKIHKILKKCKVSEYFSMNEIDYHKTYADIKMPINISALCSATHFCYCTSLDIENELTEDSVTFIKSVKFQKNMKYIMLSATADKNICSYYFGEDTMQFYDCKEAVISSTLNQYANKPMGRNSIRKNPDIIDQIKTWTNFENTISFKEFHKYYTGDLHFGNCAGCDMLKGENIDVIGTPHQPLWIYELFAYSLGYDINKTASPDIIVTHNGFRFRFYTYNDPILRNIQFYMIESELEQAVGRARLLRCNCTVNLFSDFPLKQAVLMKAKYDEK